MNRLFLAILLLSTVTMDSKASNYDVIIAGAGTGGFGVAIQAARKGCRVLLLEETDWIGGQMTAAGVATMDEGTMAIRRHGLYKEFYGLAVDYYRKRGETEATTYWNSESFAVEPAVGQSLMYEMINQVNKAGKGHIDVLLNSRVTAVMKDGNRVKGIKLERGLSGAVKSEDHACKILVDATEYGDVIPLTGTEYRIAKYSSGNIDNAAKIQDFTWTAIVKEYPGGIPENLKMKAAPPGYDGYKRHLSYIKRYVKNDYNVYSNPTSWITVAYYRGLPNSETPGIDEHTTKTSLNIAQNDVATTVGDLEDSNLRWKKDVEMRKKTLALIYYMQTELGLNWSVDISQQYNTPYNKQLTQKMVTNFPELKPYQDILNYFPVMPYVRESRRVVGLHTLVSTEIDRTKPPVIFADAVSINDYPEDLHGSKRPQDLDLEVDPGAVSAAESHDWSSRVGPFQLPLGAFIPKETDGFLPAEKNISQSRLANGATRLQPSTMLNGQAVGNLAALAVKYNTQPRSIPAVLVQWEQLNAGAPLHRKFITDLVIGSETWKAAQLCLVHGIFTMDGARFWPQDPVTAEDLALMMKLAKMDGVTPPGNIVTKADAAEFFKNYLIAQAMKELNGHP